MSYGLLLVMMEPPASLAEEFNDWYDTEHVPERKALPGFHNAVRFVCLHGWPRFLALYDLDSPAVLRSPDYLAVAAANSSPWSSRVLPRTIGRTRIEAEQVAPGDADLISPERVATLVVARYPGPAPELSATGLVQARVFRQLAPATDQWVVATFDRVVSFEAAQRIVGEQDGIGATMINLYVPYVRVR